MHSSYVPFHERHHVPDYKIKEIPFNKTPDIKSLEKILDAIKNATDANEQFKQDLQKIVQKQIDEEVKKQLIKLNYKFDEESKWKADVMNIMKAQEKLIMEIQRDQDHIKGKVNLYDVDHTRQLNINDTLIDVLQKMQDQIKMSGENHELQNTQQHDEILQKFNTAGTDITLIRADIKRIENSLILPRQNNTQPEPRQRKVEYLDPGVNIDEVYPRRQNKPRKGKARRQDEAEWHPGSN
jgi:hypothetical protein